MTAHGPHFSPITAAQLREHGLLVERIGWLTLLVAPFVLALVPGRSGTVAALVVCAAGLGAVLVGLHWRWRTGR
jgi:hypothetical protein